MAVKARQQYYADETSLKKEAREFGMLDALKDKLDSVEYGAQVNVIEEVQENGVPLEIVDKSVNVLVPEVIDNLYTLDPDNSLSAKQGKILYDMIKNLLARGRFLSTWNTATGLPMTNPTELPYEYKAGDYYIVSAVAAEGGTNFRPEPDEYDGTASNTQETQEVHITDIYVYDGENWLLLINSTREIAVDDYVDYTFESTNPVENQAIAKEFVKKQNKFYTVSTTSPSNPAEGDEWYDATNDKVFYWDGTQWKEMGGGSTYTAGLHISIDPNDNNKISVVEWNATSSALGLVKLGSDTRQTTSPNSVSSTANRTYRIQTNNSGQLMVNVPWTDNNTTYTAGEGISISNQNVISSTVRPVTVGPTAPANAQTGDLWYDTTKNTMFLYKNNSWTIIGPEIYPITKSDYEALTPAEQGDGRFFLITDNDGTIYVDWENIENRLVYAGNTAPTQPCEGYIWYDTANDVLKVYDGAQWNEVGGGGGCCYTAGNGIDIDANNEISVDVTDIIGTGLSEDANNNIIIDTTVVATQTDLASKQDVFHTTSSTAPSNPSEGDEWYDTTNDVLKVYDGTNWIVTGKTYTAGTNIDITNDVISADTQFVVVDTLPAIATADANKVYILGPIGSGADKYEEYIVQDAVEGHFESASTIVHDFVEYNVGQVEYGDKVWNKNGAITNKYVAMDNLVINGYSDLNIGDDNNSESIEFVGPGDMPYVYENQDGTHNKFLESPFISTYPNTYGSFDIYYSDSEITWVAGTPKQYVKIGETSPDLSGKQDKATSGSGAPSTTPSYIGQMYVDTTNDNLYVATGTSSSSDWTAVDTNTTYTAGDGIDITNDEISVDASDLAGTGLSTDNNNNLIVDSTVVALKSDLTNYYTKTETYTKTEVDNLISSFGNFEVVDTLPSAASADEKTIYLLGPIGTGADKYEEWIVTNQTVPGHFESQGTVTDLTFNYSDTNSNFNFGGITNSYVGVKSITHSGDNINYTIFDENSSGGAPTYTNNTETPFVVKGENSEQLLMEIPSGYTWNGNTYEGILEVSYSASPLTWVPASTTKQWTKIGETSVDLSGYATTSAMNTALATKADASDLNTKTFYISSSSDLTTAQAAYDWYLAGKNPILRYSGKPYIFGYESNGGEYLSFINMDTPKYNNGNSASSVKVKTNLLLHQTGGTVDSVGLGSSGTAGDDYKVLLTGVNYQSPYTPQYDGSPATKKYVDDNKGKNDIIESSTAPSDTDVIWKYAYNNASYYDEYRYYNGSEWVNIEGITYSSSAPSMSNNDWGRLWYDESNSVLKYYDHNVIDWMPVGGIINSVGTGLSLSNGEIFVDATVVATQTDLSGKQDKATSGSTAPSTTPSYVGQQYIDTTNDKMYVATGTSSSSDWTEVGAGSGDMLYSDFGWDALTGASVTLALRGEIEPSANFTVNKPNDLKDGQFYVLRVVSGATAYTMTLGTDVTNPYSEDLTLSANTIAHFTFLAKDGELELQPSAEIDMSNYLAKNNTTSYTPSGDYNPATKKYVDDNKGKNDIIVSDYEPADTTVLWSRYSGCNSDVKTYRYHNGSEWVDIEGVIYGSIAPSDFDCWTLWYDINSDMLKYYNHNDYSWQAVGGVIESTSEPYGGTGEGHLRWNTTTSELMFYNSYNSGAWYGVMAVTRGSSPESYLAENSGLWYDTTDSKLKYYDEDYEDWLPIQGTVVDSLAPSSDFGENGGLWYDTNNDVIKYYDGSSWVSAGGITYTAGTGITISNNTISADTTVLATKADLSGKQDKATSGSTAPSTTPSYIGQQYVDTTNNILYVAKGTSSSSDWIVTGKTYTAGNGIDITNDVISADLAAGTGINISNQTCTTESDRKGPCPSGFHVPTHQELSDVSTLYYNMFQGGTISSANIMGDLKAPGVGTRAGDAPSPMIHNSGDAYWWTSEPNSTNAEYGLLGRGAAQINISTRFRVEGMQIRPFKNATVEPTSSWTVIQGTLGNVGIFWNQTDGLISIGQWSSNVWSGVTIADKNLGATTVWNYGDTATDANSGKFYQWGNNYGFVGVSDTSGETITTTTTQVDASSYGPGNYYSNNEFYIGMYGDYDWSSVQNDDLWGDTSNSTHQECTTTTTLTISSSIDISGKQDKATSGSTAPSSTPTYIGQQYVDTTNDKLYVATGTSSSSDWMEVGAGSGDMLYADFNWVSKTGATVTLDINSTITPSANFTVNAPATIKDGQIYILRVVNGATAYTMTLGTGITNPYSTSTTLTANGVDQFVFQAIGGNLELLPDSDVDITGKQDKATTGTAAPSSTPTYVGQSYVNTSTTTPFVATGTSASTDWQGIPILSKQTGAATNVKIWVGTQAAYEALATKDANTLYFTTSSS